MNRGQQVPEGDAFHEQWRALDRDTKRRIRRAVNRAQLAGNRREAGLAVAVARGQQRFWRFGWVLGPLLAVVLLIRESVQAVIANGVFALVVFGVMSLFLIRRARRAERINLEFVTKGKEAARRSAKGGTKGARGSSAKAGAKDGPARGRRAGAKGSAKKGQTDKKGKGKRGRR